MGKGRAKFSGVPERQDYGRGVRVPALMGGRSPAVRFVPGRTIADNTNVM